MSDVRVILKRGAFVVGAALASAGLYVISQDSYLLFHSLVELFSVAVAFAIFMVAWNTRGLVDAGFVLILGVAFLFVGALDTLHALAYSGMGVFPGEAGSNLATQLWVAARFLQSASLFLAFLIPARRVKATPLMVAYAGVFTLLLLSIFAWKVFPVCFDERTGLTVFKKASEYVVAVILAGALGLLVMRRRRFDPWVLGYLTAAVVVTIASEMAFTAYGRNPFGFANKLGHFLKVVAFYLIYKALIETALRRPYAVLFRDLKQSQEQLQQARDGLEERVRQRTEDLAVTVNALQAEVQERTQAEQDLRQSEERYRELVDLAPDGIAVSVDGTFVFVNPAGAAILAGSRAADLVGRRVLEFIHPGSRRQVAERLQEAQSGEGVVLAMEITVLRPDGSMAVIESTAARVTYGDQAAVQAVFRDVSERKRHEHAIRQERQRLFSVLNMLPGYVSLVGRDHRIRFANHGFRDAFGEPGDKPCYLVQMGRDRPCEVCPIEQVFQTRRPRTWEWTSPTGRVYRAWGYPFSDTDGSAVVLTLGLDVTEQRALEKQVTDLDEAERSSIGRDLHDSLGQNLTGLGLLAEGIAAALEADSPERSALARQMIALARDSVAKVRAISKGLYPGGLDRGGLAASLAELAETVQAQSGIACEARCEEGFTVDDAVQATHLYRIAQEAVNNAVKHSRAKHLRITLQRRGPRIVLEVADDGIGMDPAADKGGMGMRTMNYRASVMNGMLQVHSRPGEGTVIRCSVSAVSPARIQEAT
jgi:PAS domain S-box-containing protein